MTLPVAQAFLLCIVLTAVSPANAQQLAWAPSSPDTRPVLDYSRRVLSCSANRCETQTVFSYEQLINALELRTLARSATQAARPRKKAMVNGQEFASEARILRLVLGSCFGGDLPTSGGGTFAESTSSIEFVNPKAR